MSYKNCPDAVVSALIRIFFIAREKGKVADLEELVGALRVLQPNWSQLDVFEAWLHMRSSKWMEALRLLRHFESHSNHSPLSTALLGCCLYAIKDPTWHGHVTEVLQQKEDAEACRIVKNFFKSIKN